MKFCLKWTKLSKVLKRFFLYFFHVLIAKSFCLQWMKLSKVLREYFFCIFFMFWSAKVVLLIDSLWHHHHHKRWEPLWVRRRKSICHLFPIIKTFGSFIVLCGGYFWLPNKHQYELFSFSERHHYNLFHSLRDHQMTWTEFV